VTLVPSPLPDDTAAVGPRLLIHNRKKSAYFTANLYTVTQKITGPQRFFGITLPNKPVVDNFWHRR